MLSEAAQNLKRRLDEHIPMARHMNLRITCVDASGLRLDAPLAPNINDKGTGFAGSLATLATLAGWALATLLAEQALGAPCEAAVFESELRYVRPVTGDFHAVCAMPSEARQKAFADALRERGRAKLELTAVVAQDGEDRVRYRGRYAVRKMPGAEG
jgi:thioesterase domain-containing protein